MGLGLAGEGAQLHGEAQVGGRRRARLGGRRGRRRRGRGRLGRLDAGSRRPRRRLGLDRSRLRRRGLGNGRDRRRRGGDRRPCGCSGGSFRSGGGCGGRSASTGVQRDHLGVDVVADAHRLQPAGFGQGTVRVRAHAHAPGLAPIELRLFLEAFQPGLAQARQHRVGIARAGIGTKTDRPLACGHVRIRRHGGGPGRRVSRCLVRCGGGLGWRHCAGGRRRQRGLSGGRAQLKFTGFELACRRIGHAGGDIAHAAVGRRPVDQHGQEDHRQCDQHGAADQALFELGIHFDPNRCGGSAVAIIGRPPATRRSMA